MDHPDLAAEQAYLDAAARALEASRARALKLKRMVEVGRGGTEQARVERDAIWDNIATRLGELDVGDAALCFGRIDFDEASGDLGGETFYIGRISVSDADQEPLIVDWRAPVAEPFYRATGRQAMGLALRRHFIVRGPKLMGIEDERFGDGVDALGLDAPSGALIAALEAPRAGRLGDIVGTIQAEQDEIIRADMGGVLVVQGGPGTGKTVVALHRAAYLLYTHRFPLADQGVLVVGPNRLFLGYIEMVLPSLGEAGVHLAVLADLVDHVRVRGSDQGRLTAVKGDPAMATVLGRAIRDRQRALRYDLRIGYGVHFLRLSVDESARMVAEARRRFRTHNAGRRWLRARFFEALADSSPADLEPAALARDLGRSLEVREALEWMWPVLTPAQLLNDLFGGRALLRSAAGGLFSADDIDLLHRPREARADDVVFTTDDVPLLDEALMLLGTRPAHREADEVRTFGHIVVDEAQDLSPMALRMLTRRSLSGSMTIVGDIAQSTGVHPHAGWDEVLEHLPSRRPARRIELSVGYRTPGPIAALAARVLEVAAPELTAPAAVRSDGEEPLWYRVDPPPQTLHSPPPVATPATLAEPVAEELFPLEPATPPSPTRAVGSARPGESTGAGVGSLVAKVVEVATNEHGLVSPGHVGIVVPRSLVEVVNAALEASGLEYGRADRQGLEAPVTLVPVASAKGLELDAIVVVEPAAIVDEEPQGMRSLYVAVTRATRRLSIVHQQPLPESLRPTT
jgi:DNA helicase IV